jgi:hypothetical protein
VLQEERWRGSSDESVAFIRRLCSGRSEGCSDCIRLGSELGLESRDFSLFFFFSLSFLTLFLFLTESLSHSHPLILYLYVCMYIYIHIYIRRVRDAYEHLDPASRGEISVTLNHIKDLFLHAKISSPGNDC